MNLLLLSKKIDIVKNILKPNSKIGFIGTAGEVYDSPIWIYEDKRQLQQYGYQIVDIDISKNSKKESIQILNAVHCIYVAGGNVFYLKQQIEEKYLENEIINFINSDKLYIGSSAGSCLCSPTLEIYKTLDSLDNAQKLRSIKGLDVIDFEIIPHYGKEKYLDRHNEIINQYESKYNLLTVKDDEALLFRARNKYNLIK